MSLPVSSDRFGQKPRVPRKATELPQLGGAGCPVPPPVCTSDHLSEPNPTTTSCSLRETEATLRSALDSGVRVSSLVEVRAQPCPGQCLYCRMWLGTE